MRFWSNEREVPQEIIDLLELTDLPAELRQAIDSAMCEVAEYGAVTYPTIGNIEFYIFNKYRAYFQKQ